jgi:hypothetical protein
MGFTVLFSDSEGDINHQKVLLKFTKSITDGMAVPS